MDTVQVLVSTTHSIRRNASINKENEGNSSIYIEGQTGLVGVNSKQMAQYLAEDNCTLSIEKNKEACNREEKIKIMTPEQTKEYERSTLRSSEEDANFKSSAKDKQPLNNQDAKELEDVDSSVSDTESQTSFIEDPEIDVIDDYPYDDYPFNEGQTDLIEEDDECPLTAERKEEARRKEREAREESIKKMTPEQFEEYEWSILLERSSKPDNYYDLVLKLR